MSEKSAAKEEYTPTREELMSRFERLEKGQQHDIFMLALIWVGANYPDVFESIKDKLPGGAPDKKLSEA